MSTCEFEDLGLAYLLHNGTCLSMFSLFGLLSGVVILACDFPSFAELASDFWPLAVLDSFGEFSLVADLGMLVVYR